MLEMKWLRNVLGVNIINRERKGEIGTSMEGVTTLKIVREKWFFV